MCDSFRRGSGTAEFTGSVAAGQTLAFTAAPGLVKLDQPSGFAGAITGFQQGDTLDLSGIVANGVSYQNGVLSLTDNGASAGRFSPWGPRGIIWSSGSGLWIIEPVRGFSRL